MRKPILLLVLLFLMPAIACTLTSSDDNNSSPTLQSRPGGIPTATGTQTANEGSPTETPTPTPSSNTGNTGNSGNNGNTGGTPAFSNISFSSSAGGVNTSVFPNGVKEVYLRWDYSNIPVGTQVVREWYRDGVLYTSNQDSWSNNWGTSGRLTHIKLFDNISGLPSGNYYVVVRLPSYSTQITGSFSITSQTPSFSNLTFSRSSTGQAATVFPYGTEEIFARWSYSNVPVGITMRREWYRNNALIIERNEAWKAEWGSSGTLTHINLYDRDSGYGLEPGNYRVVISLRDFSSVRLESTFTVEANVGPSLSNLRFATTSNGTAASQFPAGTTDVFAIFDYNNIPLRAQMRRIWRRNGTVVADRTEMWDFDKYGTNGTVRDVSFFDRPNGLASGNYEVEVQIVGQPGVVVKNTFTIGTAPPPANPVFSNLSFGTQADSPPQTSFVTGTPQVVARWDFANAVNGATLTVEWELNGVVVHTDISPWNTSVTGVNGRRTATFADASGIGSGTWTVRVRLEGYSQANLTGSFVIQAQNVELSNIALSETKGGPPQTDFAYDVGNLYAQFDFENVPSGTEIQASLVSANADVNIQLAGSWTYITTGRVTDLWIGDPFGPLASGDYTLTVSLPGYATEVTIDFTVGDMPADVAPTIDYYVPPQLDPTAEPPVVADGVWVTYSLPQTLPQE